MQRVLIVVLSIIGILFLMNCERITDPIGSNYVRGKVLDPAGNPVEGAIIELNFHTNPPILPSGESMKIMNSAQMPTTIIRFAMPTQAHVKLWITRKNPTEVVRTLIDRMMEAGYHSVVWDARNEDDKRVRSGIYTYHIDYSTGFYTEGDILLIGGYSDSDSIAELEYFAKTNHEGNFIIYQNNLPFGYQFNMVDDEGNLIGTATVTNQVKIWALHEDYSVTAMDSVYVDPETGAQVRLRFQ